MLGGVLGLGGAAILHKGHPGCQARKDGHSWACFLLLEPQWLCRKDSDVELHFLLVSMCCCLKLDRFLLEWNKPTSMSSSFLVNLWTVVFSLVEITCALFYITALVCLNGLKMQNSVFTKHLRSSSASHCLESQDLQIKYNIFSLRGSKSTQGRWSLNRLKCMKIT